MFEYPDKQCNIGSTKGMLVVQNYNTKARKLHASMQIQMRMIGQHGYHLW